MINCTDFVCLEYVITVTADPMSFCWAVFLSKKFICRGEGDGLGKRGEQWTEILSWEPRAFVYHNFLVSMSLLLDIFGLILLISSCLRNGQQNIHRGELRFCCGYITLVWYLVRDLYAHVRVGYWEPLVL